MNATTPRGRRSVTLTVFRSIGPTEEIFFKCFGPTVHYPPIFRHDVDIWLYHCFVWSQSSVWLYSSVGCEWLNKCFLFQILNFIFENPSNKYPTLREVSANISLLCNFLVLFLDQHTLVTYIIWTLFSWNILHISCWLHVLQYLWVVTI